jgi:hypothetical protein
MKRISFAGAALAVALAPGCATAPQSILLGAGSGAVVGGGTGLLISHDAMGTAIGAATGAVTGGLIALLLHEGNEKEKKGASTDPDLDHEKYPFLTRPEVRTIVVPDAIEGNRYVESHRVFIIDKSSSWSKANE